MTTHLANSSRLLTISCALLLFLSYRAHGAEPRHCGAYAYAPPFPAVSADYVARFHTIAHEFLDSERGIGPVTPSEYAALDAILDEAKERLQPIPANLKNAAYEQFVVESLRTVDCILVRHGFVYPPAGQVQLLSDGLDRTYYAENYYQLKLLANPHNAGRDAYIKQRKPGPYYVVDDDISSYIYLAVGQVMEYPLAMVPAPSRAFVRWLRPNGKYIDFDPIDGKETSDYNYTDKWLIPRKRIHISGVLDSLTNSQLAAYHFLTTGTAASAKEDYFAAIAQVEKALSADPTFGNSANYLAWLYTVVPLNQLRNPQKAIFYAEKAVAISSEGDTLDTLACAYALAGDFPRAIATEKKAVQVVANDQKPTVKTNLERITAGQTCEDPSLGKDRLPFRPTEHPTLGPG